MQSLSADHGYGGRRLKCWYVLDFLFMNSDEMCTLISVGYCDWITLDRPGMRFFCESVIFCFFPIFCCFPFLLKYFLFFCHFSRFFSFVYVCIAFIFCLNRNRIVASDSQFLIMLLLSQPFQNFSFLLYLKILSFSFPVHVQNKTRQPTHVSEQPLSTFPLCDW